MALNTYNKLNKPNICFGMVVCLVRPPTMYRLARRHCAKLLQSRSFVLRIIWMRSRSAASSLSSPTINAGRKTFAIGRYVALFISRHMPHAIVHKISIICYFLKLTAAVKVHEKYFFKFMLKLFASDVC